MARILMNLGLECRENREILTFLSCFLDHCQCFLLGELSHPYNRRAKVIQAMEINNLGTEKSREEQRVNLVKREELGRNGE
jgi:hypothetical protein